MNNDYDLLTMEDFLIKSTLAKTKKDITKIKKHARAFIDIHKIFPLTIANYETSIKVGADSIYTLRYSLGYTLSVPVITLNKYLTKNNLLAFQKMLGESFFPIEEFLKISEEYKCCEIGFSCDLDKGSFKPGLNCYKKIDKELTNQGFVAEYYENIVNIRTYTKIIESNDEILKRLLKLFSDKAVEEFLNVFPLNNWTPSLLAKVNNEIEKNKATSFHIGFNEPKKLNDKVFRYLKKINNNDKRLDDWYNNNKGNYIIWFAISLNKKGGFEISLYLRNKLKGVLNSGHATKH